MRCDVNVSLNRPGADVGHPVGDEERQLAALGGACGALRGRAAGGAAAGRRADRPGDPALPRGDRHQLVRAARRRRRPTTATSPSPTWCRSRRTRRGWSSCGPRCPSRRRSAGAQLVAQLGLSELDSQAMVNAGVLDLVLATVEAGAPADQARNWWLGALAQAANAAGVDAGRPGHHAGAGRPGRRAGRRPHAHRRAGPPGRRGRAGGGGRPGRGRRRPRAGRRLRRGRARRGRRRGASRPSRTSPTRSAAARCRRPARWSARS